MKIRIKKKPTLEDGVYEINAVLVKYKSLLFINGNKWFSIDEDGDWCFENDEEKENIRKNIHNGYFTLKELTEPIELEV